jgi:hypothetical protein
MPTSPCAGCGQLTNSATSNWWDETDRAGKPKQLGIATECYAAYVEGRWVCGCGYAHLDNGPYGKALYQAFLSQGDAPVVPQESQNQAAGLEIVPNSQERAADGNLEG